MSAAERAGPADGAGARPDAANAGEISALAGSEAAHGGGGGGDEPTGSARAAAAERERVTEGDVMAFLFPDDVQHPKPAPRLFLLAEHGPLAREHSFVACFCDACKAGTRAAARGGGAAAAVARDALHGALLTPGDVAGENAPWLCDACRAHCASALHIKGGRLGRSIVAGVALSQMEREVVRGDALRAYHMHGRLSEREADQFLEALPAAKKSPMPLDAGDVRRLLARVPRDERGTMCFYDVRRAVERVRAAHVARVGRAGGRSARESRREGRGNVAAVRSELARSLAGKRVPDHLSFRAATRLLHQNAFKITEVGGAPQPGSGESSLRLNVYLMRQLEHDAETRWRGIGGGARQ